MPSTAVGAGRVLWIVASLNAGSHVAGLALAAWGMRPGTPHAALADRLHYLAHDSLGWQIGWAFWMLCVPVVITFFFLASERLATSALARLALSIVIVAGAVDLSCDAIFLLVFPRVAEFDPTPIPVFLAMERGTIAVSLIVANGLYSVASLLLTMALQRENACGRAVLAIGYAVAFFGGLLAVAGFTEVPWHAEWATGPTIGLYAVWTILVARSLSQTESRP